MTPVSAPTVLLVDDNEELVENLAEILSDAGYRPLTARSYTEGLKVAREGMDLALVDLRLPDGDGTMLAGELKALYPYSEVVLLTGHATVESAAAAVRAGACAYLVKPVNTDELLLTIEQAMRQVRLHHEKHELSRRAQTAEKLAAVGTLTAGLSHEIRNPLNAAGLQLQVLERRIKKLPAPDQGPLLEPLALVRDEIRRLDHVLEDFLQFARPASFTPRPVDMAVMLAKVEALFREHADQRGVQLELLCPKTLVAGDEGRLRQVAVNLVLNAIQATQRGGTVSVRCERRGGEVALVIEDNGPGISQEMQDRIFEPFYTTKPEGSGLGLSIVNSIVLQHGGSIELRSEVGRGTRFTVLLPPAQDT